MENLLKRGMSGNPEIAQIQQKLKQMGYYQGNADGIYGPLTESAVKQFQQMAGIKVDGIVGPQTRGALNGGQQPVNQAQNAGNQPVTPGNQPVNQGNDPTTSGGQLNPDELKDQMVAYLGREISQDEWDKIYNSYYENLAPEYKEYQDYDKSSLENQLGLQQRNFDRYTEGSANNFLQDKNENDVSSAQRGVLFSSSRQNDLNNLQNSYKSDLQAKQDSYETNMKNQLMDYQRTWGTGQMSPLSNYFKMGGQSYDAFTPGGKTQQTGLSSFYNPSSLKLSGTRNQERTTTSAIKAANYFKNMMNQSNINKDKQLL